MAREAKLALALVSLWFASMGYCWKPAAAKNGKVEVSDSDTTCPSLDLRLAGGYGNFDGLVLVRDSSSYWHRLCFIITSSGMDLARVKQNVEVMCRNIHSRSSSSHGRSKASIVLRDRISDEVKSNYSHFVTFWDLDCKGTENFLSDCRPIGFQLKNPYRRHSMTNRRCWYTIACDDDENFEVKLIDSQLFPGDMLHKVTARGLAGGALQATSFGMSGIVCAPVADLVNLAWIARTSCRQQGYRSGVGFRFHRYDSNGTECFMPNTICLGDEKSVSECKHEGVWGSLESEQSHFDESGILYSGRPVHVTCAGDSPDVELVTHLDVDGSNASLVYINYHQLLLLPVIASSSPDTCQAICQHVLGRRDILALCGAQRAMSRRDQGRLGDHFYYATMHCKAGQENLTECAYGIDVVPANATLTSHDQQLSAHCAVRENGETSRVGTDVRLLYKDSQLPLYGCVQALIDNEWRPLASYDAPGATNVAWAVCSHLFPSRRVTSATNQIQPSLCPTAQIFVSCRTNSASLDRCSYAAASSSQASGPSLFVACAVKSPFNLRLTKGFGSGDGAVKVQYGDLDGYVDTSGWTNEAASVTCRQLGMRHVGARAIRKYSPRRDDTGWSLRVFNCFGNESSLEECRHEWTLVASSENDDNSYVGGVSCGGATISLTVERVAPPGADMVGIPALRSGDALTYFCLSDYSGGHGRGAAALCREAGYKHILKASEYRWKQDNNTLRTNSSAIVNLACGLGDADLEECTYEGVVDIEGCAPQSSPWSSVAALKCESRVFGTRVRLVGGLSPFEGHVEISRNGEWGAICDDRFDDYAATLVCKEIFGQQSTGNAVQGSRFATRNERFLVDELWCMRGQHSRLQDCSRSAWGEHDCTACEQAGVACAERPYLREPLVTVEVKEDTMLIRCSAEAFPPAKYQWFTNGTRRVITGSSLLVDCQESSRNLSYVCNAFNEAGEQSIEVMIGFAAGCPQYGASSSRQTGYVIVICLISAAGLGAIMYAFYLRRLLRASISGKMLSSVSYANPIFS